MHATQLSEEEKKAGNIKQTTRNTAINKWH